MKWQDCWTFGQTSKSGTYYYCGKGENIEELQEKFQRQAELRILLMEM